MATKKLDGTGLQQVWSLILANFAAKALVTEMKTKLDTVAENAQVNVIESVKVNGTALEVTEKGVNILVPTGTLADLDEVGIENLNSALKDLINGKADKATTLTGYGIADAYTKTETDNAISTAVGQAVAGVYKVKGSVEFASLPTEGMVPGDVYNVSDAFTAGDTFVTSEVGKSYPAGTNVCYTENGWDAMAGTYDFSEYAKLTDIPEALTAEEIAAICTIPE